MLEITSFVGYWPPINKTAEEWLEEKKETLKTATAKVMEEQRLENTQLAIRMKESRINRVFKDISK